MSHVPNFREEEALVVMLKCLAHERKGQATVREIKGFLETKKMRPWNGQDALQSDTRSGAPMWHQIVQNASDRLDSDRHYYRTSFVRVISAPPHKILQITDEGRSFVKRLASFEEQLRADGFELYHYLDEAPLERAWTGLKEQLRKNKISYDRKGERDDLLRSLRSREYGIKHHLEYENANIHAKILKALERDCDGQHAKSVHAWRVGREYIGSLANLDSQRDRLMLSFQRSFLPPSQTPEIS